MEVTICRFCKVTDRHRFPGWPGGCFLQAGQFAVQRIDLVLEGLDPWVDRFGLLRVGGLAAVASGRWIVFGGFRGVPRLGFQQELNRVDDHMTVGAGRFYGDG